MKKYTFLASLILLALVCVAVQSAQAMSVQLGDQTAAAIGARASVSATASSTKAATALAARITNLKNRAEQEITRRVMLMNQVLSKINTLVRLSADEKTNLSNTLQTQITAMNTLAAKVSADTDVTTLKTDVQSITKSYRIFMLVVPQAHVAATADAIDTTVTIMATVGSKLQTRLMALENAGKDTTTLNTLLADYNTKSVDAKTQADAAVSATASLQPDNGDQAVIQTNKQAFTTARTDIKTAQSDLKTARSDAAQIITGIKSLGGVKAGATTTTSVQ